MKKMEKFYVIDERIELLLLMSFYVSDVVSVVICACKHLSIHILGNQGLKMGFWMKKS